MSKIIREILALLWKVIRLVLWKWLKPRLARMALLAAAFIGVIVLLVILLTRG